MILTVFLVVLIVLLAYALVGRGRGPAIPDAGLLLVIVVIVLLLIILFFR